MNRNYTIMEARVLVTRLRDRIDHNSHEVLGLGMTIEGHGEAVLYAQTFTPDEQQEDLFNDTKFVFWSSGIRFATNIEDIDISKTHYILFADNSAYMMQAPIEVPNNLETELPWEFAEIPKNVKLTIGKLPDAEIPELAERSIHNLPAVGGGGRSEYYIAADVLKKRLLLKDMDEMLKWAIFNSKSPKANIQAINFALNNNSRKYTHGAWHLMHAIRDLYRSIDRQSN